MNNNLSDIRAAFIDYFIKNNHKLIKSSSLIPHNDNSLLFTNAGMVQFKNVFLGLETLKCNKAVSVQKCLRAGGKHNDLDNVGYTARHQTFFEMLGNFSFEDYFKEQAILYAFNFIHKVLGISKDKLLVTVYHEDKEAYELWQKIAGFSNDKIIKINTNDNFWSMGDTGPCGPSTEIFYDLGPSVFGGPPGSKNAYGDRFTEIWNLVFMQYNSLGGGKIESLKTPSVDTGMGLERITAVMQGVLDNYDIDIFKHIISATENLLQVKVNSQNKSSFKVIADHIRASIFLINDGVLPSNEGRGYVLRRIIRRAVRHGYLLGNKEPKFYKLVPLITDLMKNPYSELKNSLNLAEKTICGEEEKFNKTIEDGMKLLNQSKKLVNNKLLSGSIAFKLYDTYGFPLDLTESILRQENIFVDVKEFNKCMEEQKLLSKKNWSGSGEVKDSDYWFKLKETLTTEFVGYSTLFLKNKINSIVNFSLTNQDVLEETEEGYILFDKTPFYPEGGGQSGDKGIVISLKEGSKLELTSRAVNYLWNIYNKKLKFQEVSVNEITFKGNKNELIDYENNIEAVTEVLDTFKVAKDLIVHKVKVLKGKLLINSNNILIVNQDLRKRASANHTATHILFTALKKVLGYDVAQQGSLVTPYRFRADVYLNHSLSLEQIKAIEVIANNIILENYPVHIEYMPYSTAVKQGVTFLMGENYPDTVRVVSIKSKDNFISKELCGGCHIGNTGEIGLFKIISETAIKSGVRRIEVVTGKSALQSFQHTEEELSKIFGIIKANKNNILEKLENLTTENKELKLKINNLEAKFLIQNIERVKQSINNINFVELKLSLDELTKNRNTVISLTNNYKPALFFVTSENKDTLTFLITISSDISNKINLLEIIADLRSKFHAKGGGNSNNIQGSIEIKHKEYIKKLVSNNLLFME